MASAVTRAMRSGWIPFAALLVLTCALLLRYQTPAGDVAKFVAYLGYGIVIPGTLVWRALRTAPRSFVEDVAGGAAVGYSIELLVYLAARAVGLPLAVAFWPAVVIVAFLAVPGLRRHWRAADVERAPAWFSWTLAGVIGVVFAAGAVMYYRWHGLSWPWVGSFMDTLYQLALAGELKHHVPPTTPYLLDAPLAYHWFVHAHLAAASWTTGIELQVLLYRFVGLPMLAVFTVLVALIAKRISGRWSVGALAAVMTFLVSSLSPYQWSQGAFWDLSLLEGNLWYSPTQTFGAMLFAAAVLVLVDRLRGEPGGRREWVLVALLLTAVMGAKATFLPLLLAGLGLVFAVALLVRRRLDRPALVAAGITGALFVFATLVLFSGGSAHALQLKPLQTVRFLGALQTTGLSLGYATRPPVWLTLLIFGLALLAWAVRSAGIVGLLVRRERALDPAVLLLAGISLTGVVLLWALRHPGVGQTYFIRSVAPFLAILSACGLGALVPAERATRRTAAYLAGAAAGAGLLAWIVPRFDSALPPTGRPRVVSIELLKPIVLILAVMALGVLALVLARRKVAALRGISAALAVAAIVGLGLAPTADRLVNLAETANKAWRVIPALAPGERPIPKGAIEAGRWLRDHSRASDLVATNTHCRRVVDGWCDNRHFWLSGYAERRVLVESWGYTPRTYAESWAGKGAFFQLPYWDTERLADNDRAFQQPSEESVQLLRTKYRVRWLVVDERYDPPSPELAEFAEERFRSGDTVVYEIPGAGETSSPG